MIERKVTSIKGNAGLCFVNKDKVIIVFITVHCHSGYQCFMKVI